MNLKLQTQLISGAGNTFHVVYGRAAEILQLSGAHQKMQDITRQICKKNKADGLIFLENAGTQKIKSPQQLKWYFFNNDGSDAEMCGNATRCVGFYIHNFIDKKIHKFKLETIAGEISVEVLSTDSFKVNMSPIIKMQSKLGFQCDTGVPHLVLPFDKKPLFKHLTAELKEASRQLRFHPDAGPRGSNVTYIERTSAPSKVFAVSYERGVEDFTAACGTGAMAAAFYMKENFNQNKIYVEMPGGELIMDLSNLDQPVMTGPATNLGSFEHEITL